MTDKTKSLQEITSIIANDIFREYWNYRPNPYSKDYDEEYDDRIWFLLNVVASLHNLLYESETGKRYDYMFHWANKGGGACYDNIFDKDFEDEEEE